MDSGALYLTIHLSNSVRATTVADLCGQWFFSKMKLNKWSARGAGVVIFCCTNCVFFILTQWYNRFFDGLFLGDRGSHVPHHQ
jgi:hypothetical protein